MPIAETIQPDWQDADIPNLAGGLSSALTEEAIGNTQLTQAQNMRVERNLIVGDLGYYPYKVIAVTVNGSYAIGDTVITLSGNGARDAKAGGKAAVYLDNSSIFVTTIVSVASGGNNVTLAEGLPYATSTGRRVELERYILGVPMKFHKLELANGTVSYFLITSKTLYRDSNLGYWEPIAFDTPAATAVNVAITGGSTVFAIDDTAGLAVGDVVRIARASLMYYVGIITAMAAGAPGTITCAGEPFGTSAIVGAEVRKCVTLTGTNSDKITAVTIPWADAMVFTNGVDRPKVFDNTTVLVSDLTGTPSAGNTIAKSLAVYDSSLFLISTIEGGTNYKQRVRYCDNADLTEWTARNAGYVDLLDTAKECYAGKILGPYLYIYREKGIFRVSRSQRGDRRFDFDEMITNHGILSPDCVVEIAENLHVILDSENIFSYDGGFAVTPIGDPIKRDLFGTSGTLDFTTRRKSSLLHLPELRSVFAAFQSVNASDPVLTYHYSIDEKAWTTREFPAPVYALGKGNASTSITWLTVQGTWAGSNYAWNAAFASAAIDTILLGLGNSPNAGSYVYEQIHDTDAGDTISYVVQTKNFLEIYKVRIDWLDIWCSGGTIVVEYSIDRGTSWFTYGTISAQSTIFKHRIYKQFIAEQYMFRIRSTDPGFSILKLRIRLAPETEQ